MEGDGTFVVSAPVLEFGSESGLFPLEVTEFPCEDMKSVSLLIKHFAESPHVSGVHDPDLWIEPQGNM